MVAVVAAGDVQRVKQQLGAAGETVHVIGHIEKGTGSEPDCVVV
jgi:phosphoribosylaminoimidazole (AIR) synthetase